MIKNDVPPQTACRKVNITWRVYTLYQAMKAVFYLNALFDTVSLDILDQIKLFDNLVILILNYGFEVWWFHSGGG